MSDEHRYFLFGRLVKLLSRDPSAFAVVDSRGNIVFGSLSFRCIPQGVRDRAVSLAVSYACDQGFHETETVDGGDWIRKYTKIINGQNFVLIRIDVQEDSETDQFADKRRKEEYRRGMAESDTAPILLE